MRTESNQWREKSIGFLFGDTKKSLDGESSGAIGSKIKGIFRRKQKE
jgi:hypothetical protein